MVHQCQDIYSDRQDSLLVLIFIL